MIAKYVGKRAIQIRLLLLFASLIMLCLTAPVISVYIGGILLALNIVTYYEVTSRVKVHYGYLFGMAQLGVMIIVLTVVSDHTDFSSINTLHLIMSAALGVVVMLFLIIVAPMVRYRWMYAYSKAHSADQEAFK